MFRISAVILLVLHAAVAEDLKSVTSSRRFTYEDGDYEISPIRMDWFTARNYCKLQGGDLISIETPGENSAVLSAIRDYITESFWTSGSDLFQEGTFYWDSTGVPVGPYTNWGPDQPPSDTYINYIALSSLYNHLWAIHGYRNESFFICEFHPCQKIDFSSVPENSLNEKEPSLRFTFENGTYEISTTKAAWQQAKNACRAKGMRLVSIESFEENLAILDALVLLREESFWTSGTDVAHEGNFYWESTGHAVGPYTNWAIGQPNQDPYHYCIAMWSGSNHLWDDTVCTTEYYYICEQQPCQ